MKIDLSWGNPEFLHPYWQNQSIESVSSKPSNYLHGISLDLRNSIKCLHSEMQNANYTNAHIVVGNGATQLLTGLIHVLSNPFVKLNGPHYSRLPKITQVGGKQVYDPKSVHFYPPRVTDIVILPNNPTGRIEVPVYDDNVRETIYDLCYFWPQYIEDTKESFVKSLPIKIFSLSKATGHAGSRIGWAIIQDKDLADKLDWYVENSSNGVSIHSQNVASTVINHQLQKIKNGEETVFQYGEKVLSYRWKTLKEIEKTYELPFQIDNNNGMFVWCKGECPKFIIPTKGSLHGVSDNYFRLNLGCSDELFEQLVILLKEGYEQRPESL